MAEEATALAAAQRHGGVQIEHHRRFDLLAELVRRTDLDIVAPVVRVKAGGAHVDRQPGRKDAGVPGEFARQVDAVHGREIRPVVGAGEGRRGTLALAGGRGRGVAQHPLLRHDCCGHMTSVRMTSVARAWYQAPANEGSTQIQMSNRYHVPTPAPSTRTYLHIIWSE
eukprot:2001638-Prymnesium_polylepis.3